MTFVGSRTRWKEMHYFYRAVLKGKKFSPKNIGDVNEVKISVSYGNSWEPRTLIDNEMLWKKKTKRAALFCTLTCLTFPRPTQTALNRRRPPPPSAAGARQQPVRSIKYDLWRRASDRGPRLTRRQPSIGVIYRLQ